MEKIILFFWQNCVSPHQLPYIKELYQDSRIDKVYLIAPVWNRVEREKMGWLIDSEVDNVEIIIAPDEKKIDSLFSQNPNNSIHFFSGIRADKFVFDCFKISLNYEIKRGLITEPPFDYKKPLLFHKIRFLFFDYKYIPKINFVFAMGNKAAHYFNSWSKNWKVVLFGYCVESPSLQVFSEEGDKFRFVYVGSLIKLKNVILLLKSIANINAQGDMNFSLDLIGDGPEYKSLSKYVDNRGLNNKISFLGKLSMKEVRNRLSKYDVLILPSIRDGWGAVINEGLQSGLFIISSDNCGAKTLVENSSRGIVFKNRDLKSLTNALHYCIENIEQIRANKDIRIKWSEKISGKSIARYMVDCLFEDKSPTPPWIN